MATTQQPRTSRGPSQSGPDPASRGLLLIVVAVALGAILLLRGGVIGFDSDDSGVDIGSGSDNEAAATSSTAPTTAPPPSTVAPAEVKVVAANGAGITGFAGKAAEFLATQGYTQVGRTDATQPATVSAVYWAAGFEGNAQAIATSLGVPEAQVKQLGPGEQLAEVQDPNTGVVVVLASDVEGKVTGTESTTTASGGGAASTSSTVSGQATTTTRP